MKLTAKVKLLTTARHADALHRTLVTANAACTTLSQVAWYERTFRQFDLHRLCYADIRAAFGLSAQLTVRCIAKVTDAYKIDRTTYHQFVPLGAVAYDDRILSWNLAGGTISIWTVDGRQTIPFAAGSRQQALLTHRKGETDLVCRHGVWYLLATCDVAEPPAAAVADVLGVDLGVTNIATTSDGVILSGATIKNVRYRQRRLRQKLQRKGTRSAKRRLKHLAGQEQRFAADVNHRIAKELVHTAERTKRGMALEDLRHIRTRIRARRSQQVVLQSWAFAQLQMFIAYKARLVGVPVVWVDPRNTSRTCPACGHCAKANRRSQAVFVCTACGAAGHADVIAAANIRDRGRAVVMQPHVSEAAGPSCQGQAPAL